MLPIEVLENHAVQTGWNTHSMLAITLDFLQLQAIDRPALLGAFQRYVEDRACEENELGEI
jgi:hypothetical protein